MHETGSAAAMPSARRQYRGCDLEENIESYLHVYFLGTGGPSNLARRGTSTLIRAGSQWLLFDTGSGMLQQMNYSDVPVKDICNVFYTHLHSDHVSGFNDFWMTGWFVHGRTRRLSVLGPPGTAKFIEGLRTMHHFDLDVRLKYDDTDSKGLGIDVQEFSEGVVHEHDGVKVTAFLVDHGPVVKPAYGFRVDWNGRSVVLSGDTTLCDAVIEHAKGADLLIHEMACASHQCVSRFSFLRQILSSHTTPEQLAVVCSASRPRLTMINHISHWNVTPDDILVRTRAGYDGAVEISEDGSEVLVGPDVRIFAPLPPRVNAIADAVFGWSDDA